jgi:hypothetical protein
MASTYRSGWVTGDIIASEDDPNRGRWLTVWGSAHRSPVLHANRRDAVASDLRGDSVAQVTEYPMPGASSRCCYRIAPGTLGKRGEPQRELAEADGSLYNPVVRCGTCRYLSPATFTAPVECPACALDGTVTVMGETALTSDEYRDALAAWLDSLKAIPAA